MGRSSNANALIVRDTVSNLWAKAAIDGVVAIRLPSRQACFNVRNKLHAHRSALRRFAQTHTGFSASAYDKFKVLYRQEVDFDLNVTGAWILTITEAVYIQFELLPVRREGRNVVVTLDPSNPTEPNDGEESPKIGKEVGAEEFDQEVLEAFAEEVREDADPVLNSTAEVGSS